MRSVAELSVALRETRESPQSRTAGRNELGLLHRAPPLRSDLPPVILVPAMPRATRILAGSLHAVIDAAIRAQ